MSLPISYWTRSEQRYLRLMSLPCIPAGGLLGEVGLVLGAAGVAEGVAVLVWADTLLFPTTLPAITPTPTRATAIAEPITVFAFIVVVSPFVFCFNCL